ncbi:MAG: SIR2 family protein [Bacillota bacterium]
MEILDKDCYKQVDELLASNKLSWLFGAGISVDAGIPLMGPLTLRIFTKAREDGSSPTLRLLETIKSQLPGDCHIEHILSHIADYATIAERSKDKTIKITNDINLDHNTLVEIHSEILRWIAEIIRWGYVPQSDTTPEQVGSRGNSIVKIDGHCAFINAIFNRTQAGIAARRHAIKFFTTNYDTLLEDALSMGCLSYWDGFSGGAVAYRSYHYGDKEPEPGEYRAHVIKLHGSIDWHLGEDDQIWRVRDGDLYPEKKSRVLIYPQATKYLATQRDPFASQFDLFRRTLGLSSENVLAICGYSFGDEHINQEIELALRRSENKTTILAFVPELNDTLEHWRTLPWSKRLYIITASGIYSGVQSPMRSQVGGQPQDWWKFEGITKLLSNGVEACIL